MQIYKSEHTYFNSSELGPCDNEKEIERFKTIYSAEYYRVQIFQK